MCLGNRELYFYVQQCFHHLYSGAFYRGRYCDYLAVQSKVQASKNRSKSPSLLCHNIFLEHSSIITRTTPRYDTTMTLIKIREWEERAQWKPHCVLAGRRGDICYMPAPRCLAMAALHRTMQQRSLAPSIVLAGVLNNFSERDYSPWPSMELLALLRFSSSSENNADRGTKDSFQNN